MTENTDPEEYDRQAAVAAEIAAAHTRLLNDNTVERGSPEIERYLKQVVDAYNSRPEPYTVTLHGYTQHEKGLSINFEILPRTIN